MLKELENFEMQKQQTSDWCWAANAVSVALFYDENSNWSQQCALVNEVLRRSTCCHQKDSGACSVPLELDVALKKVGHFYGHEEGPLSIREIKRKIDGGFPIAIRIKWDTGHGHFLMITGYDGRQGTPLVFVKDPQFGDAVCPLSLVVNNYQEYGSEWSDTYFTDSQTAGLSSFRKSKRDYIVKSRSKEFLRVKRRQRKIDFSINTYRNAVSSLPVYSLDFNSLYDKKSNPITSKYAFRILASDEDRYLYDFEKSTKNAPLLQVIVDNDYLNSFHKILEMITENIYGLNDKFTLRVLRQSELGMEAFWLHHSNSKRDKFIILRQSAGLKKGELYTKEIFVKALQTAATRKVNIRAEFLKQK
ncbi:papain-like cysteine protease family protein [Cyclobacterium sp. SYSU L10401]|uniref:papain-like cysteine protease family protein n=1 Tax=Cyclobacterium sp. SYSU L10401 TaxID=2678657 RepID=UPI0013D57781|nr:papain-like cysteine protease family protein [Cyclobacterium sp. SYSU L10401]